MALLQNAKNRIVARGAGIVCMVASNRDVMFIFDEDDFDRVKNHTWCVDFAGYLLTGVNRELVRLHRFVLNAANGVIVDHKNRDKLDNRQANLRIATEAQNQQNHGVRSDNSTGFKGVSFDSTRHKFKAEIHYTVDGVKFKKSKRFNTLEEAARQYNEWAREHHGEFAYLNNV